MVVLRYKEGSSLSRFLSPSWLPFGEQLPFPPASTMMFCSAPKAVWPSDQNKRLLLIN
jgi:hypothetical protein